MINLEEKRKLKNTNNKFLNKSSIIFDSFTVWDDIYKDTEDRIKKEIQSCELVYYILITFLFLK